MRGADVRVVMTDAAQQFVQPLTFQALSGHTVHTDLLDTEQEHAMSHIHLARWADCLVIAPATANLLAKLAHGLADNLLSTLYLAAECPVMVVPAMNPAMWRKSAIQRNIEILKQDGVRIIGPETGEMACGEQGLGRMVEPSAICEQVLGSGNSDLLKNINVLITAGPTREPIDPVRFISNRSSGKMGFALAEAAQKAGANVTLIHGPVNINPPSAITIHKVETAMEMYDAVLANIAKTDICIAAAAVADYHPVNPEHHKIKKTHDCVRIELHKNPDIIAEVAKLDKKPFIVGFAAETDDLETYAKQKLLSKNLDMIAANWVGKTEGGFESDSNALEVFWQNGHQTLEMAGKQQLAEQLLSLISERYFKCHQA
jgi:phosphopantothenoylcysteine decarboxylase/phosphopantothenate--cysteine ligase